MYQVINSGAIVQGWAKIWEQIDSLNFWKPKKYHKKYLVLFPQIEKFKTYNNFLKLLPNPRTYNDTLLTRRIQAIYLN